MSKHIYVVGLIGAALAVAQGASAGDTLDSVGKTIAAEWDKTKSLSAIITMTEESELMGRKKTGGASGTLEYMKKGEKQLIRIEIETHAVEKLRGQEKTRKKSITRVCDGEFHHEIQVVNDQALVTKTNAEYAPLAADGKAVFELMRLSADLKLLGIEKIEGSEVFVIEATPKVRNPDDPLKSLAYFRKEGGVLVKTVTIGAKGKPIRTLTYTDVRINPTIAPERFVFKAPPGAKFLDKTK